MLVFDAGGETRAGVSGGVTTVRFLVRGGAGLVIDGAMRDIPSSKRCRFKPICAVATPRRSRR